MARKDKARYEIEKTMYNGPWKVVASTKRMKKDGMYAAKSFSLLEHAILTFHSHHTHTTYILSVSAPKRPPSAFLSFSNSKRTEVKQLNKELNNTELSRVLAKLWKEAPEEERKTFIDEEFKLRQKYKESMKAWKKANEKNENDNFKRERELEAARRADYYSGSNGYPGPPPGPLHNDMYEYGHGHSRYPPPPPPHHHVHYPPSDASYYPPPNIPQYHPYYHHASYQYQYGYGVPPDPHYYHNHQPSEGEEVLSNQPSYGYLPQFHPHDMGGPKSEGDSDHVQSGSRNYHHPESSRQGYSSQIPYPQYPAYAHQASPLAIRSASFDFRVDSRQSSQANYYDVEDPALESEQKPPAIESGSDNKHNASDAPLDPRTQNDDSSLVREKPQLNRKLSDENEPQNGESASFQHHASPISLQAVPTPTSLGTSPANSGFNPFW